MHKLIKDPYFSVAIDNNSRQVNPDLAIWNAMHICVDGGSDGNVTTALDPVQAVIKHALTPMHWDVLHHASVKVDFTGFPHDTAMQMRTHTDAHVLVQSMRYSDERYTLCSDGHVDPQELFYFPHNNDSRQLSLDYGKARRSCRDYANAIERGAKKETARRYLLAGYRQNFTVSATFCNWMHIFDRRLLADSQGEVQTANWMALNCLRSYSQFFEYYRTTRASRNMLAP